MRFALVRPFMGRVADQRFGRELPAGILSLAGTLESAGHEPVLVDVNALAQSADGPEGAGLPTIDAMVAAILGQRPQVIGFSVIAGVTHDALLLARAVKDAGSPAPIVFGGPGIAHAPERLMDAFPWIDLVAVGEGERTILEIAAGVQSGDFAGRPGILYRRGATVVRNPDVAPIANLDDLPMPAHHLWTGGRAHSMEFSRGCRFGCDFCSTARYWGRSHRVKSPERIRAEIRAIRAADAGPRPPAIVFTDDNLASDRAATLALCRVLREEGVRWSCSARADALDEELVAAMAGAGCCGVFFGAESGSDRVLARMHKGATVECSRTAMRLLAEHGMHPDVSLLYGYPGETESDLRETLRLAGDVCRIPGANLQFFAVRAQGDTPLLGQEKSRLVLRPYDTDLLCGAIPDLSPLGEAATDPELFPHFLTIEGSTVDRYPHLAAFMTYVVRSLAGTRPHAWDALMSAFGGEILDFFLDFQEVVPEAFAGPSWFRAFAGDPAGSRRQMARWLFSYLERRQSGGLSFRLAQLYLSRTLG